MSHLYEIGSAIKTRIETLLTDVQEDGANSTYDTVSRASQTPYVSFRMRRSGRGREDEELMRIEEGVTIVPMKPVRSMGTNECDGVGYRYLVAIAQGRLSDEIEEEWALAIWEQAIRRRFHNKRLGMSLTSACELRTSVEPGELPNWMLLSDSIDASFLVLTEYVRESRRG